MRKTFKANKVSGVEASVFGISIILEIIKKNNQANHFLLPFYAVTWNVKSHKADEWIDEKKYQLATDKVVRYVQTNGLRQFIIKQKTITKLANNLRHESLRIMPRLRHLSKGELIRSYHKFVESYSRSFAVGAITFLYEGIVSEELTRSLLKRYPDATKIIANLIKTSYKSFMARAEVGLLKIKPMHGHKREQTIKKFLNKYYFLRANYLYSPILTHKDIEQELKSISSPSSKKEARGLNAAQLTKREQAIIDLLKITEPIRDQRKLISLIGSYAISRFLDEALRRVRVSRGLASRMFWFEYPDLINRPGELRKKLQNRNYAAVVLRGKQSWYLDYLAVREITAHKKNIKLITGTPAASGQAVGRVRVVLGPKTFAKFKPGDILVTEMTRPDFVPIMRQAAAIVTDEGGLTSHAAVMAREFGIPCVVGTKIATQVFKDGDKVEVDAVKGIVRLVPS